VKEIDRYFQIFSATLRNFTSRCLKKIHPLAKQQISREKSFHGSNYGGWTLCPTGLDHESIVFSIGVGEDASFDRSVIESYGAQVYAFDPTPRSIDWVAAQAWPPGFHFYPYGLADRNGSRSFHPPENPDHVSHSLLEKRETEKSSIEVEFRTISELSKLVGHKNIDVLKMDIEGAEYEVIQDILAQNRIFVHQILVEFHDFFPEIPLRKTLQTIRSLNQAGYVIFHISPNGREYSFIKVDDEIDEPQS